MSARTLDYRGRLVPTGHDWQDVRDHLQALAVRFPVGARVVWLAWAPADRLRAAGKPPAVNRPSNRATVNGRQKGGRR